jgi:hypothetical protein
MNRDHLPLSVLKTSSTIRDLRVKPNQRRCPRSHRSNDHTLLVASGQNESTPETGALPKLNRSEPQAATLVGLTSRSLLELAIGTARGFIASGISRTRSTCRSPFSRLAPLT